MVLTMTWLGSDYQLSLIAETTTTSEEFSCLLGYFNPKCIGMIHCGSGGETISGETITINPNAFLDSEGKVIADKRILLYVTNAAEKSDIAQSNA